MSSRRSRFQLSIEVLTVIAGGEDRITRIMYSCNLSWNSLLSILSTLESKGYVENCSDDGKNKRYRVTSKGREVISYYKGLHTLVQV